jgi:cation:H+ antiporter
MITLLTFIFGLVLLAAGGELLIRSSSRLAQEFGVSRLFIGLTVVAFGTSAPEAVVSVFAALNGSTDLALANVIGSNIFNVLFILGISALITPLAVSINIIRFDVPLLSAISFLLLILSLDGFLGRWEGILFLVILIIYVFWNYRSAKITNKDKRSSKKNKAPIASTGIPRQLFFYKGRIGNLIMVLCSLMLLVIGSRLLVSSASSMARRFGISEIVIGLTVVAAGTSLPEVATSVIAAIRGERDIAVGNIIGSNVFNILGVLGLSTVLAPSGIKVSPSLLAFDIPVMLAVALLCLPIFINKLTVFQWEGGLLLGYFLIYTLYTLLYAAEHDLLSGFSFIVGYFIILNKSVIKQK